ncbi:membrane lipoprotein lipid attachment site-containing protein [Pseudomonas helleri]|uniref:Lipoprotein n=1 Tax=Pseudomonas helleri TaxID=1608996 RepID=A0A7X1WRE6_9PSED|nr:MULTISPECIES: membrane lipoprotein lipid attachment site-containing protein [Pseudomonas]MQT73304.1 hypothetical protein [Pseudomonas helleri]
MKNIIFALAALAMLTGCDGQKNYLTHIESERGTASLMDGRHCNFHVREEGGRLVPVDSSSGDALGLFERWPNGAVQLTTPEGYTPNVTDCLMAKGFAAKLRDVPPYWVPHDKKS